MSTIKKQKSGKFQTQVYDIYGTRHRKNFDRKSEAEAYISKLDSVKHEQKLVKNQLKKHRYLIEQAIDDFHLTKYDLRPKTLQKYSHFVKQFKLFCNAIGVSYVDEFTTDHAIIYYNELTKEKKDPKGSTDRILKPHPRTSNYYLRTARAFFHVELINGHIDRNPLITIKYLRNEKKPPEYYSKEEIQNFFAQEMQTAYRNAFTVLLHTGMRFEELASLRWDNIDLPRKLIYVRPTEDFKTKTYRSIRAIPMNTVMLDLFTNLSNHRGDSDYPVCSVEGHKLRERRLYYICDKIGKKAKIVGKINLHKFRHTFASHLVQNDTRIEVLKELLGHSSIKETMVYAHIRSEYLHDDVRILDNLFDGDSSQKETDGHTLGIDNKNTSKLE